MAIGKKGGSGSAPTPPAPTPYGNHNLDGDSNRPTLRRGILRGGRYILRVDGCAYTNGYRGETYRADFTVLKVIRAFANPVSGNDIVPNSVGEEISDFWKPGKKGWGAFLRQFLQVGYDITSEEWEQEGGTAVILPTTFGDDQSLAGAVVEVEAAPWPPQDETEEARAKTASNPFCPAQYIRRVPASELPNLLEEATLQKYFPDIEKLIAEEAAAS